MKKKEFFEKQNVIWYCLWSKSKDPHAINILCSCSINKKIQNKELAFYLDQICNRIQRIESIVLNVNQLTLVSKFIKHLFITTVPVKLLLIFGIIVLKHSKY